MNPSIFVGFGVIAAILGGLAFSFHTGRTQGNQQCEADRLQAELVIKQQELKDQEQHSKFQQEQIQEAQDQLTEERTRSEKLQKAIDTLPDTNGWCIPPSLRNEIIKFRSGSKAKTN